MKVNSVVFSLKARGKYPLCGKRREYHGNYPVVTFNKLILLPHIVSSEREDSSKIFNFPLNLFELPCQIGS